MKPVLIIYCVFLCMKPVYSQEADKPLVMVQYTFTHIRDTTQRGKPYIENMFMVAGKKVSRYSSLDNVQQIVSTDMAVKQFRQINPGSSGSFKLPGGPRKPVSSDEYYFYADDHKLVTAEDIGKVYLVQDPEPGPIWKISKDTLSFSGIHCQKASATFRGRNWIAWFATELPFESGPWKLNGLPGLIIEAYDDKQEVQFRFAGLQQIKDGDFAIPGRDLPPEFVADLRNPGIRSSYKHLFDITRINTPDFSGVATRKEFEKLKEARMAQGMVSGGGGGLGGGGDNTVAPPPVVRPVTPLPAAVINNPIELPKK